MSATPDNVDQEHMATQRELKHMSDRELAELTLTLTEESVLRLRAIMQILEALGANPMVAAMLPGFKVHS